MDGLLYTIAAKNLSHGIGSWWNMHINNYSHPAFFEQPPLTFWIQSIFFKVLGDSIYTERIYSFITACISAWLILKLWNLVYNENSAIKKTNWLPLLFWIIVPFCFWTYANNMEECTMSVFILLSVWLILKGFKNKNPLPYLISGGVCIFLSSMCKGIQGMFPLALVVIYRVVYRDFSFWKMLLYSLILFAVPAAIYLLLLQMDSASHFFKEYFDSRLYKAFNVPGVYTTGNRFEILIRLVTDLSIPAGICLIMFFVFKKQSLNPGEIKPSWRIIFLFLLIGLSGSLPLIATLEQRRFYLVPSVPFFAIALASVISPGVSKMIQQININGKFYRTFKIISITLFIGVIIFSAAQIGKTGRDKEMLHDVYAMGNIIPGGTDIGMSPSLGDAWSVQFYFTRHYNITLVANPHRKFLYLIMPEAEKPDMEKYSEVKLDLKIYRLYKLMD